MTNPGGKIARQDSVETIIRDLQTRIGRLERLLASVVNGGTPTPGGLTPAIYTLTTPATTWTIVHGRNRIVTVEMFDPVGSEMDVDVTCTDPNTVVISGTVPFSGKAIVV